MNEGDLVRIKKERIDPDLGDETLGIIIDVITPDVPQPWIHVMFGSKMRLMKSVEVDLISEAL